MGAAKTVGRSPPFLELALSLQILLLLFSLPMVCPWGSETRTWGKRMNGEICWQTSQGRTIPQTLASPGPPVCMSSELRTREILSIRAGKEPVEISWSSPLVLQVIITMITLDGGNSQRAFTSGLPLCAPESLGLANGGVCAPPCFVREEAAA